MKKLTLTVVALTCVLLGGSARAQVLGETPTTPPAGSGVVAGIPAQGFGAPGQVVIAGDFSLGFLYVTDTEASSLSFRPALDVFIAPNISVGGQINLDYQKAGAFSDTRIGLGPRVGYNAPLGDMFSIYPRLGLSYQHVSTSPPDQEYSLLTLLIYAPFLFHPATNFFIGLGPSIFADIAGANSAVRTFTFGLQSTVGGYFDW